MRVNGAALAASPLPPFVRRRAEVADENRVDAWDGWAVNSNGDTMKDYALGRHYADFACELAVRMNNATVISFTLSAIYLKQAAGLIEAGTIERGFIDRIAQRACGVEPKLVTEG